MVTRALRKLMEYSTRALEISERARLLAAISAGLEVKVQTPAGPLQFVATTPTLLNRARGMLAKEPDTIAWIDGFKAGDVFWDIGANVGVFSLYAAAARTTTVLAFEPSAENYAVLSKNIVLNGLQGRVSGYCIALAGKTELGVMNLSSEEPGSAVHQFGRAGEISPYLADRSSLRLQAMTGFRIDDFVREFAPPFPNHIKVDVDGLEGQILTGASQTIRDRRLRSIMIEIDPDSPIEQVEVVARLAEIGLVLSAQGPIQVYGGKAAANHYFVRPENCRN